MVICLRQRSCQCHSELVQRDGHLPEVVSRGALTGPCHHPGIEQKGQSATLGLGSLRLRCARNEGGCVWSGLSSLTQRPGLCTGGSWQLCEHLLLSL